LLIAGVPDSRPSTSPPSLNAEIGTEIDLILLRICPYANSGITRPCIATYKIQITFAYSVLAQVTLAQASLLMQENSVRIIVLGDKAYITSVCSTV
jgi:hypothetical protein